MSQTLPLVSPCVGNSAEARLAGKVAAGLERLGVAELVPAAAVAVMVPTRARAQRSRRPIVAIDGCREGCTATLLRSQGLLVSHAMRLDELAEGGSFARGHLIERAARLLESPASGRALRRGTGSRYLCALLKFQPEGAAAAAVARSLEVTRQSAGETLERLRRWGLVERRPDKTYALTTAGTDVARGAVRRRRTVECFLADFVGYPTAAVHDLAQPIADALSDDAVELLFQRLGAPARCPHGRPIDPPSER